MKIKVFITIIVLTCLNLSCDKEELSGNATLHFHGIESEMRIGIYPIELWGEDILNSKPILTTETNSINKVKLNNFLPGNYFWWDYGLQKGIFQIIEGEDLNFDYYFW